MGLAIMRFYLNVPIPIYGTLWILLLAFVTSYIPYGIRYTHSGLLQLHKELEEASYVSGASWLNCMRRITLPLIMPSFLGGLGIRLLAFSERTLHVHSFGKPADTGSVSRYLRAVGKWSGGRAGGIQCDLDGDIGERRSELLFVCSPVRSAAGLRPKRRQPATSKTMAL